LLTPVEPHGDLAQSRPVGSGVDQHVQPAAAGQAEIDQVRAGAETFDQWATGPGDLAGQLVLEAAVGQAARDLTMRADRELRPDAARKAAVDTDHRTQTHARLARRA